MRGRVSRRVHALRERLARARGRELPYSADGRIPGPGPRLRSWLVGRRLGECGRELHVGRAATIKNPGSISVGDRVVIRDHAWLNCERSDGSSLTIGGGTYIGRFVHINASRSVVIEDHALIADRVYIADYQHDFSDTSVPIVQQGFTPSKPVVIGRGSWLGEGAVVMPGVTIGEGAIVGANAVVTKDVSAWSIVGGVPASVIGTRRP